MVRKRKTPPIDWSVIAKDSHLPPPDLVERFKTKSSTKPPLTIPAPWQYTQSSKREVYLAYLFGLQGGRCAICATDLATGRMAIDHCHRTGYIRGLLCRDCNLGLGLFKDNVGHLKRAAKYLDLNAERLGMMLAELQEEELASPSESDRPTPTE
jgi:recombination endonuclease VII